LHLNVVLFGRLVFLRDSLHREWSASQADFYLRAVDGVIGGVTQAKHHIFMRIRMLLLVRDLAGLELGAPGALVTWFFPVQGEKVQWT